jgi:hypothetical protein
VSVDRERGVTEAFVSLANSLVDDFDVVELLSGLTADCARLLDVASAGVLLADRRRVLHVLAASSEVTRNLELFQLQRDQGPCLDCYHSGTAVTVSDLGRETTRWPLFVEAAGAAGFASVHAVPMRLHDSVLGTLGLFGTHVGSLGDEDVSLAQALAHVGSVAILQGKAAADKSAVAEQLQGALDSRVVLEQAKGLLAQAGELDMSEAFDTLRRYARDGNKHLTNVARALVSRELRVHLVLDHAQAKTAKQRRSPAG